MRSSPPLLAALVGAVVALPVCAQEDHFTLGYFVTVRTENVPEFEQAAREHNQWHASQNDPQPWVTYQALTGRGEYAVLAPDMTWASLDAPVVDMGSDIGHWADSGAPFVETEEVLLWSNIPGGSPPEDPSAYPIVQVYGFEINSGGQSAAFASIERANEALSQRDIHFEWSAVISQDGPPSVFLAIWFQSFADLGAPSPGADQIMADAFGPGEGARVLAEFSRATTASSSIIWTLRPDLSYLPAM